VSTAHQTWLVARREMRERGRSRGFQASLVLMILAVVAVVVLPSLLERDAEAQHIGLTGAVPVGLPRTIASRSDALGHAAVIHRYDRLASGQQAVRDGDIDVLVVDARQLEWRRDVDEQLETVVAGAIQLVAIQARAAETGISPEDLTTLVAPVKVTNVELGQVEGRSPDDETAAFIMTLVLFMAISTYGAMVMSGVVEEKSSRVVEVLLARMPARNLLAGKIAGIGLLGFGQIALTVLVALVALNVMDSVDVPAARGSVLAWVVVWFVLGYALYATVFGALGALASRTEDTSSAAGPVTVVLVAAYLVSFAAIGSPDSVWARLVSYFPATAPLAMPSRLAMGAADWWEPLLAVVLTLATIVGLVVFGGRVYAGGILHSGPTLSVQAAWRRAAGAGPRALTTDGGGAIEEQTRAATSQASRYTTGALLGVGVALGAVVAALTSDLIIGVAIGAAFFAASSRAATALTARRNPS
jgi:ABC-2 type transport system permease protein